MIRPVLVLLVAALMAPAHAAAAEIVLQKNEITITGLMSRTISSSSSTSHSRSRKIR
jgi:hypothetical protein